MTTPPRSLARVIENAPEGEAGWRLRLALDEPWPAATPGQFVMLSAGAQTDVLRDDPLLPRPMAIYRVDGAAFDVLYKVVGRGTGLLAQARTGDRIRVVGPLGRGFSVPTEPGRMVLVGGGTGIASLYDLARTASDLHAVKVLLGARSGGEILGRADFAALPLELAIATDDGSEGHQGLVTELLEHDLKGSADPPSVVYACGPTPMMERAADVCRSEGVRCEVSLENRMACGIGVCLGCAAPRRDGQGFHLVCRDGPVFDEAQLEWSGLP